MRSLVALALGSFALLLVPAGAGAQTNPPGSSGTNPPGSSATNPPGSSATTWLCKPGVEPNPCYSSLETTVQIPGGGGERIENPPLAARPKIDCFYVYPTVSDDAGTNSDLSIDPEQISIARYQAARFSQRCRVWAPMYRQLTLNAIGAAGTPRSAVELAYSDVAAAWSEYWKKHNKGRGVVLIGHSQGTGMLTQLVRERIDPFAKARRRLVSALLIGGNVHVAEGRDTGGSFEKVPACRTVKRTGCVVAYSIYDETPPPDALFGRPGGSFAEAFGLENKPGLEILCNNPAALAGGTAELRSLVPTSDVPGTIGAGVSVMLGGRRPTAATPWVEPPDRYTGACIESNGANVLLLGRIGSARDLLPVPDATWGLHLGDINLALGNLVDLVGAQSRSYTKLRAKRKRAGKPL